MALVDSPAGMRTDGIDRLYFFEASLVAVQNLKKLNRVARFHMTADLTAIQSMEGLLEDHPSFDIPTTGVIVGNELFLIANSQLASYDEQSRLAPLEELDQPVILRVDLSR